MTETRRWIFESEKDDADCPVSGCQQAADCPTHGPEAVKGRQMVCLTCWFDQPLAYPGQPGWEPANRVHMRHDGAHHASWYTEDTEESVGNGEFG